MDEIGQRYTLKADFRYKHAPKGFAGKLSPATVEALRSDPRVAYIEQDQIAHIDATQTNPTCGLDRIDQRALPLDNSYTYNQTGAGVDVYCIDTGIRFTHVDFGGRAVTGYDAITPGGTAADGNGHGTHTAGTIGGSTYGVAKGVHLIAVRMLNNSGSGTYSQVISGIDWVTANHTTTAASSINTQFSGKRSDWRISTSHSHLECINGRNLLSGVGFHQLKFYHAGITSTSTSVPGLASNSLYYWRVNATNAGGTSAWSAVWHFRTAR